ncbi:MAG: glycosyltransferase [Phycisphaerales bacterium]|nr:glycosyltransferase [Phycisphaerales bacterium]
MTSVSLVIPGRNCEATLDACLSSAVAIMEQPGAPLKEIIFVNDGSTDGTEEIAARFPVTIHQGGGNGPGAARNAGWRRADSDLIWFVDSDCVMAIDALATLLPHMDDEQVGGVSGTYGNASEGSLLACLIHEEIIERHRQMTREVDFLATFNVLYRRHILAELDGFDERYLKAQDAELSFRVRAAGHRLHFEHASRVDHYHEQHWGAYLRTQRQQGFWRVWLHLEHPGHGARNSYSNALDHLQPIIAMLLLVTLPLLAVPDVRWVPAIPLGLLLLAQIPMTARLVRRLQSSRYVAFAPMSAIRAIWRGVGMTQGVLTRFLKGAHG